MTAQTVSFLKNSLLATGQATASITPTRMQDIPDSFPPWDDPANASTLGAPAILRGTVSTYNMAGLTIGAGQTTGVRQANATVLNNAIAYCVNNGKFFETPPGVYEINSSTGLLVPSTIDVNQKSFTWRGCANGTQIVQFYATSPGAPILTVGDPSGAVDSIGVDISGLNLYYGAAQTGFTSSCYLLLGFCNSCNFEKLQLGAYTNPAYLGISMPTFFFSNRLADIQVTAFQNFALNSGNTTTANSFDNMYLTNAGTGTMRPVAFIYAGSGNANRYTRVNCEHSFAQYIVNVGGVGVTTTFDDLHIETVTLTGTGSGTMPCIFSCQKSFINCTNLELVDLILNVTNYLGGATIAALVQDYVGASNYASNIIVNGLKITNANAGNWATVMTLYQAQTNGGALDNFTTNLVVNSGIINDTLGDILANRLQFDSKLPVATFKTPAQWGGYNYGTAYSRVDHPFTTVSATYTHYGQYEDAVIQVPVSITGFTITLAATMGATGGQLPRTGNTVRVRRMSGSVAGALVVTSAGTGGGTLTTNGFGTGGVGNTAGTDAWAVFDGAKWVSFVPVTS